MPAGIAVAHDELDDSQNSALGSKVIVLLSDGQAKAKGDEVLAAARSAKDDGIRIITIGLGRDAEADCKLLRAIASSEQDAYFQPTSSQLADTFLNIAQTIHTCASSALPAPTSTPPPTSKPTSTPPMSTPTLSSPSVPTEMPTLIPLTPTDILPSAIAEPGETDLPPARPDSTS